MMKSEMATEARISRDHERQPVGSGWGGGREACAGAELRRGYGGVGWWGKCGLGSGGLLGLWCRVWLF